MRWRIRPLESAARRGTRSTLGSAALASIALAGMIGLQIKANGRHLDDWDLMTVSGTGTFLAGLLLAQGLPAHFWAMLDRLINRGALIGTDHAEVADVSALIKRQMGAAENRWERSYAFAVAATMAMAVIVGAITVNYPDIVVVIGCLLLVTAGGYFAGRSIGRALAYSTLPRALDQEGIKFCVTPGHVDGAAGLKPFGTTTSGSRGCLQFRPSFFSSGRC